MTQGLSHDALGTIVGALCNVGPLLDTFGVTTADIPGSPAAAVALSFLEELAYGRAISRMDRSGHSRTLEHLETLAGPVRSELLTLPLEPLARWIRANSDTATPREASERFWSVFAPSCAGALDSWDDRVTELRERRQVTVEESGHSRPGGRILFTSNVLLTATDAGDEQRWFFDHPMVIGADVGSNEIVHGLVGLNDAVAFEKDRGTLGAGTVVDCVLSVSVTHESLVPLARYEVARSVAAAHPLEHLAVYAFTESDTQMLVDEVLAPAVGCEPPQLGVFGVNGNYGRHYNFLKAIAALWQAVVDPAVDRTFKLDLDQVFPQETLVAETGRSAFELLAVGPRWGAVGTDSPGDRVELGMCAGALVNASDLGRGIFTPDVERPTSPPRLPDLMFRKSVAQALSTEAEMMDRGGEVRQRVHVTGGTTGIMVDALTRHRPFTPSFIARAEDQAYLMSVLRGPPPRLRTVHIPGLFMRHDKGTVAGTAVRTAEIGTAVGDYERVILFTGYARALGLTDTGSLDPFTGSYISEAPLTVTLIGLMLDVIDRTLRGDERSASDLLDLGVQRVAAAYDLALAPGNSLSEIVDDEREAWNHYYKAVTALAGRDDLTARARTIITSVRIR